MDGTVNEGIVLHKGQEKRKVWKMALYGINKGELSKNVGNKGTCPFTFNGQRIRKALISCFGMMLDQYIFSIRLLLDNTSAISPVCHSVNCNVVTWLLQNWGLESIFLFINKWTPVCYVTKTKIKGKGKCTAREKKKSTVWNIPGRKQWQVSRST